MRHPVFFIAIGDIVGGILHLYRGVCHRHSQSCIFYHPLVVVTVAHSYHLLALDAQLSEKAGKRLLLFYAGGHTLQKEAG